MTTEEIQSAVARFPDPDPKAGVLSTADKTAMDAAVAALHEGGKSAAEGLVAMFVDRNPVADSKARHALHAWIHHVWTIKDDAARAMLASTMASALAGDKPKEVQAFFLAQIQISGDKQVVAQVGRLLHDAELCDPACAALVAIREGAVAPLLAALPKVDGRMKLAVVNALGALADTSAAAALRDVAKDEDRDTRIAACWALASIGDVDSIDLLIKSTSAQGWERTQAVKHCLVLAENLAKKGNKAEAAKLYRHLHDSRIDAKEAYVREAALSGLTAIGMKVKDTVN